jgi:hypothetical protein
LMITSAGDQLHRPYIKSPHSSRRASACFQPMLSAWAWNAYRLGLIQCHTLSICVLDMYPKTGIHKWGTG